MQSQSSAILARPVVIEIEQECDGALVCVAEAIEVRPVEGSRRVERVLGLERSEPEKEISVQILSNTFDLIEISFASRSERLVGDPSDEIAPDLRTDYVPIEPTDSSRREGTPRFEGLGLGQQLIRYGSSNELVDDRPALIDDFVNDPIEIARFHRRFLVPRARGSRRPKDRFSGEHSCVAQLLLDAEKLVVFCHSVATGS